MGTFLSIICTLSTLTTGCFLKKNKQLLSKNMKKHSKMFRYLKVLKCYPNIKKKQFFRKKSRFKDRWNIKTGLSTAERVQKCLSVCNPVICFYIVK